MEILTTALTLLVSLIHFYFLYLEMVLWTKPKGMKTFRLEKDFAEKTKVLAANQGLYNGFLAAGILWSWTFENHAAVLFFLWCVIIAGIYGSYSLKKRTIFYIQSIPAILAIAFIYINTL
ncbi:DUF1304 domain-containing protein [Flavicella sp.]|uniref:DUF1304 domain-containing protein n=1 Tax=Flavicella sp. TaxID=2957742 RepID=UPI002635A608|nr:DUF1304 domain-containing protein [Flavicella sp.]MDG1804042.1 DUF1304 domain-containing protein [Flavicella sp.]MDG2281037.1 DUF1304 domain-containing protein [Flavicella sp.]